MLSHRYWISYPKKAQKRFCTKNWLTIKCNTISNQHVINLCSVPESLSYPPFFLVQAKPETQLRCPTTTTTTTTKTTTTTTRAAVNCSMEQQLSKPIFPWDVAVLLDAFFISANSSYTVSRWLAAAATAAAANHGRLKITNLLFFGKLLCKIFELTSCGMMH